VRIHIFGASGSGTTTLGKALAATLGIAFLDADDFFWEPTVPPFATKTEVGARVAALAAATEAAGDWVLSGSMMGWGDFLVPVLDLAVYLYLPPEIRMARLMARERERYGNRIDPRGELRAPHLEFMAWAERYETAGLEQRSRASHAAWMEELSCPILRIEGAPPLEESVARVVRALGAALA
jgi:adenylate kinase family enzyme